MGAGRRLNRVAPFVVLTLALGGCSSCNRKDDTRTTNQPPPDHLAPGEIVEGKESAYGLPLPRLSRVLARLGGSVHVTSALSPEQLTNFVRERVKEGTVTPGTSSTKLENVIPRDDASKRLTIDVRPIRSGDGARSEMIVRDTTPPPLDPNLTQDQRWRKAGLSPTGALADPKRLE